MTCCKKTVTLTGAEQKVEFKGRHCDVRNDGAGVVYVSCTPGVEPDADGVLSIPPGQAVKYCGCRGVLYLLGEGKVLLCGNDYSTQVFRGAATSTGSGEGGVSQTYVDMQDADTLNKAKEYAEGIISNPNLLDNPDFSINQRGISGEFTEVGRHFVDRWVLLSGSVSVNPDGTLLLNGEIGQRLEKSVEDDYTAQANAGTASYDDTAKLFTLAATNEVIRWAKLERGSVATPFVPPNPAVEMAKCQWFLEVIPLSTMLRAYHANGMEGFSLASPKRVVPTVTVYSADGEEGYLDAPLTSSKVKITGAQASKGAVVNVLSDGAFTVNGVYRGKFIISAELE